MQIRDLGEFGVIALLNEMVVEKRGGPDNGAAFDFRLLVDTGDDTAAWHTGQGTELCTTDTMVEDVHFTRQTTPWRDLGWKSLASNISDIAAMGGLPLYALVTLGLPPETQVDDLKELYQGLLEIGSKYGVGIVGGDLVRSPVVFITLALTGVQAGAPMLRSTAKPADQIGVTGYIGGSGGGLKLMQESIHAPRKPPIIYVKPTGDLNQTWRPGRYWSRPAWRPRWTLAMGWPMTSPSSVWPAGYRHEFWPTGFRFIPG